MRKNLLTLLVLLVFSISGYSINFSKISDSTASSKNTTVSVNPMAVDHSVKARKLTLKEKIGLLFLKKQLKNDPLTADEIRKASSNATLSLIFSVLGIFLFPLFVIPGIIIGSKVVQTDKLHPNELPKRTVNTAKAARFIGWLYLGIVFFVVLLVLIYAMNQLN